ncbi:MAG: T9SS type A sorting domain-containing protein [Cytophagaceae bacterium]|jgi:hypothetical protein|nr:T9SS type A sorting domain-containing protein [Cytophagaceae bacterium]
MKQKNTIAIISLLSILIHSLLHAQLSVRKIKPSDTDASISTFTADSHCVYLNTQIASRGILLVHLPGSYGIPERSSLFGILAANLGFHSIGLMYPNIPTVATYCGTSSNATCFDEVRKEIVEGYDYSPLLQIQSQEGILHRVRKLVAYLHSQYPSEGWDQYLNTQGELTFSSIIFSGHSQGGGHAAMLAKLYPLHKAICFSSPKDVSAYYLRAPSWLSEGVWQTSPDKILGFNHTGDSHPEQLIIWDSLNKAQPLQTTSVDGQSSPFGGSLFLETSYAVTSGDEHASTIQDNKTPKVNNVPVFEEVWEYLLTQVNTTSFNVRRNEGHIQIGPNPAKETIYLLGNISGVHWEIRNPMGILVMQGQEEVVEIKTLPTGVYSLHAVDSKGSQHFHILKSE